MKWKDFQQNVSRTFGKLRKEEDFFDVTLVSDDEEQIHAHKLVLSACSDFFKSILKKTASSSQPLLYLDGVSGLNLLLILDYIYYGEVEVKQEHLDEFLTEKNKINSKPIIIFITYLPSAYSTNISVAFLSIAKKLKIEGLKTDENIEEDGLKTHQKDQKRSIVNIDLIEPEESISEQHDLQSLDSTISSKNEERISLDASAIEDIEELDQKINELISVDNGVPSCTLCGKTAKLKSDIKRHIETHMEGLSFPCQQCEKTFKLRQTLQNHCRTKHMNCK